MTLPTTVHFHHYFLEFIIKIIDNIVNAIYITRTRCIITKYKKPDYVYSKSKYAYYVHRRYTKKIQIYKLKLKIFLIFYSNIVTSMDRV